MEHLNKPRWTSRSRPTLADLLLGALAGAAAVFVMDRVGDALLAAESEATKKASAAADPEAEQPGAAIATGIEQAVGAHPDKDSHAAAGQAVHYALGVVPAMAYAALRRSEPWLRTGRGALFGAGLWLALDEGVNWAAGLSVRPDAYPWQDHARGLASHLVFGVVLDSGLRLLDEARAAA